MSVDVRLGEEFDEVTTDGRKCKTTVTMDGNKLVTKQVATDGGKDALAVKRSEIILIVFIY